MASTTVIVKLVLTKGSITFQLQQIMKTQNLTIFYFYFCLSMQMYLIYLKTLIAKTYVQYTASKLHCFSASEYIKPVAGPNMPPSPMLTAFPLRSVYFISKARG